MSSSTSSSSFLNEKLILFTKSFSCLRIVQDQFLDWSSCLSINFVIAGVFAQKESAGVVWEHFVLHKGFTIPDYRQWFIPSFVHRVESDEKILELLFRTWISISLRIQRCLNSRWDYQRTTSCEESEYKNNMKIPFSSIKSIRSWSSAPFSLLSSPYLDIKWPLNIQVSCFWIQGKNNCIN